MSNSNDPGILRNRSGETEDLFIFGYASKIFRDDAKALYLDQGKHLIPWMGNETVKIDRYDARGYLSEVSNLESQNSNHFLTPEEKRIEQMCDEERYFGLNKNYDETEMYQEEELKRLKQALSSEKEYGQVAYKYTESSQAGVNVEEPPVSTEEQDEPFVASPFLDIPQGMVLPATQKENHRIEKTASTVSSHGSQMEILIKIRQASNKKLGFLHVGHPLNPYYNLVLGQMKIGRYRYGNYYETAAGTNEDENEHYLHPSLAAAPSSSVECAPSIPSIAYKPSSNCVYAALVNNIKNVQQIKTQEVVEPAQASTSHMETPATAPVLASAPVKLPSKRSRRHKIRMGPQPEPLDPEESENMKKAMAEIVSLAKRQKYDVYEALSNLESLAPMVQERIHPENMEVDPENFYDPEKPTDDDLEAVAVAHYSQSALDPGVVYTWPAAKIFAKDEVGPESVYGFPTQEPILQAVQLSTPKRKKAKRHEPPPPTPSTLSQQSPKPPPVCFSIKKPRETERLEVASVFPVEESSEEEEEGGERKETASDVDLTIGTEGDPSQLSNTREEEGKNKVNQPPSNTNTNEEIGNANNNEIQHVNGVPEPTRIKFSVKDKEKPQISKDKLNNGKIKLLSTDIILEKRDKKGRDESNNARTEMASDPKDSNGLLSPVDCKIDVDVPLPPQSLTDISCQMATIDISTVQSAGDRPIPDEEDVITISDDMTDNLSSPCTKKASVQSKDYGNKSTKSEMRPRRPKEHRYKPRRDFKKEEKGRNGLPAPSGKDKNRSLPKTNEAEDEATIRKREERKRKIKEMMEKLSQKAKTIGGAQEPTSVTLGACILATAKLKEAESSDCEIIQAETSSNTSDVAETDSRSVFNKETNPEGSLKPKKTTSEKEDSKKLIISKESFELKLRKQVKKTLEMLKSYPKFASPFSVIDEQISTLDQTFTNLSSMTDAICEDNIPTSSPMSERGMRLELNPISAKKPKKSKKSKSEIKISCRTSMDGKPKNLSSLNTDLSESQFFTSEPSESGRKKMKSKRLKHSTKGNSEEPSSSQKSFSKPESVSSSEDLVERFTESIKSSSRTHHSSPPAKLSSFSSKEDKHVKQKKNTATKGNNAEYTKLRKSREKYTSESSESSSEDVLSLSDSSSSDKRNGSEESERRRKHRKHRSHSHKKRRHNHKSKSKRSHKSSKSHPSKSRRRSRDKSVSSD